jgi:hypothetical protein
LPWSIFIPTTVLIVTLLVFVIFPTLLADISGGTKFQVNTLELGIYAMPLLVTNCVIFALVVCYHKGRLPTHTSELLRVVFEFEISKKLAFLVLVILIGTYTMFTANEVWQEDSWEDFDRTVRPSLEQWSIDDPFSVKTLVYFLGNSSLVVFGTYRAIPFLSSLGLLVLTYLVTLELSKKRFSSIIAVVLVIQSNNFLAYDTTITYPNFWIMFYLLSLYLIFKKWYVSIVSYVLSIFTKILAVGFIPFSVVFTALSEIPTKKKILVIMSYCTTSIIGVIVLHILNIRVFGSLTFNPNDFFSSMTILPTQFRQDIVLVLFLLPVVFGLFIKAKNGISNANSVLILIFGTFLLAMFIPTFTTYTNSPYRFIPLSIFFAVGVGMLLARKVNRQP